MKKAIFLDRDGTLVVEPPDEQVDSLEKLEFLPGVFRALYQLKQKTDFELVIVSNQDGMGTAKYPEEKYKMVQSKIEKAFRNEGVEFSEVLIDKSFEKDNSPNRKPRTGLLTKYMNGTYDLTKSFVIGDRITDIELAKNLDTKGILIGDGESEKKLKKEGLLDYCALISRDWQQIAEFIILSDRTAMVERFTKETQIKIELNLDGTGKAKIKTGIGFFDHMLEQVARHAQCDINIEATGDLHVDEHHTVEDTGIALGEAFIKAFGDKRGTERYGFVLPMDDSLAQVAIDFSGRPWLIWEVQFKREMIGEMPTELFFHFFKSFSDTAKCNLNIKAEGDIEHHKIEAIFKAFAKSIKMAKKRDVEIYELPTTKGVL